MRMKKIFIIILLALVASATAIQAKDKDKNVVYVLGASISFSDSTVYFTEIQEIEGVELVKGFLPHRHMYAYELKDYMNFKEGMPGRTSVIFFSKKRSKVEKKEKKMKERIVKQEGKTIRYLGDKFVFTKP